MVTSVMKCEKFPLERWTYAASHAVAHSDSDHLDILLGRERISTGMQKTDEDHHSDNHRSVLFLYKVCVQVGLSQNPNKIGC
jgi:hypothetical protein